MTDSLDTRVVVVKRWTRYGKDRAYASLDELQLGYRDLLTGELSCELSEHRALLDSATDESWREARATRYRPRHGAEAEEAVAKRRVWFGPLRRVVHPIPVGDRRTDVEA